MANSIKVFSVNCHGLHCMQKRHDEIFLSPKMAAILNFRIFAQNGKTQIWFDLLNRAR